MGKLINIDNGGTLTDICVIDGTTVLHTKTVTTPYDLSQCFIDGLRKTARQIYGDENRLDDLLLSTDYIRYSTTQGTNAVVERKGPRLGLILGQGADLTALRQVQADLFSELVGERLAHLDVNLQGPAYEAKLTAALTSLSAAGANRIVVCFDGPDYRAAETRLKELALRRFPRHLLGVVPVLCAGDLVEDTDFMRRAWSALFNAFLHPVMESFLYNAEAILREHFHQRPLLIFGNDGDSARVARTVAIKTYSSGPRGGMEGGRALALQHRCQRLLTMDIGGTTADIGLVEGGEVRSHKRGTIGGAVVSLPLCDVASTGVGGSSLITVSAGRLKVGPESASAAPGPACFGLGGRDATITDVFLLTGLIDPTTYFGGSMPLDRDRARAAVESHIARPLGCDVADASIAAERAWIQKVSASLRCYDTGSPTGIIPHKTTLAAFGGAGPFVITAIAEASGIESVIIPGLAAVFSAFGIGFSDIAQRYEAPVSELDEAAVAAELLRRARRDMFAEGFDLDECRQEWQLAIDRGQDESVAAWIPGQALPSAPAGTRLMLRLRVVRGIHHPELTADDGSTSAAPIVSGTRVLFTPAMGELELPVYRLENQPPGAAGMGPCILEEAYFTGRIDSGWRFRIDANRDVVLKRVS
ncbi:MAG TPA: hydantoinase/oxoprolinase family protein [Gammaproteobacteria bacterium]|nr:hydantoinase/oxoprolinase family protein [Gammaproteobacteria bacterium]